MGDSYNYYWESDENCTAVQERGGVSPQRLFMCQRYIIIPHAAVKDAAV